MIPWLELARLTLRGFQTTLGQTFVLWAPLFLGALLISWWYRFKQTEYIKKTQWVLFEIKLPRQITKFPTAMEVVMGIFHQGYEGNWFSKLTQGIVRSWFSLELVSLGGEIHFFIRAPIFFKNLVESQIYSQYPEVEVQVVDDYALRVAYGGPGSNLSLWGAELGLTRADPYPIKTYMDYHLTEDDAPKEEMQVDPMTPVLELLGSIGPSEQIWIQILLQATKDRYRKPGSWFALQGWKDEGTALIQKLMKRDVKPKEGEPLRLEILSPGEREVVAAVERSISKIGFDCGIRMLYLAPKDKYNIYVTVGLTSAWKQYNSAHLNGFKPARRTTVEYPWQDFRGLRQEFRRRRFFDAYQRRAYFYYPYRRQPFVLNAEELATIYHFPGAVARTPTLEHIESKKGEAPVNLPL